MSLESFQQDKELASNAFSSYTHGAGSGVLETPDLLLCLLMSANSSTPRHAIKIAQRRLSIY